MSYLQRVICIHGVLLASWLSMTGGFAQSSQSRLGQVSVSEARKSIAEGNIEWGKARITLNKAVFQSMLAPDFYVQLADKRLTRKEFLEMISDVNPNLKLARFDATVLTVEPSGDLWSATIKEKLEIDILAGPHKGEKAYSLWVTRDKWREESGKWMITSSEEIGHEDWVGATPPFQDW
jgi:hypothetical protein